MNTPGGRWDVNNGDYKRNSGETNRMQNEFRKKRTRNLILKSVGIILLISLGWYIVIKLVINPNF